MAQLLQQIFRFAHLGSVPEPDRHAALRAELQFWREWFVHHGLQWPQDYARRFDPDLELQPELATFARSLSTPVIDVLDVGAGPVTRLGKHLPGKQLRLVATDLLADEYNQLIDELGVRPLLRTIYADAEKLTRVFPPDSFDIVHAQNTMDHMQHPLEALDQMIDLVRPGGTIYLRHEEFEGRHAQYKTLHQWDFYYDDASRHFFIRRHGGKAIDITQRTAGVGRSLAYREGQRVVFELTKGS